jgi:hypothetical protein
VNKKITIQVLTIFFNPIILLSEKKSINRSKKTVQYLKILKTGGKNVIPLWKKQAGKQTSEQAGPPGHQDEGRDAPGLYGTFG